MKTLWKLFPAAAVALAAGPALAAVTGSHHDLTAYAGATEVCLYCHGLQDTVVQTDFGNVGALCVSRCHQVTGTFLAGDPGVMPNRPASINETGGAIGARATLDAIRTTANMGHGLTKANLYAPATGTGTEPFDATATASLPYAANAVIECTTCHNVHSNTNTPFLQANLFTGGTAARPSFCEACHTLRGNSWAQGVTAPNGEHPTNFALAAPGNVVRGSGRIGRYINLDQNIFDQSTPNGAALNVNTNHYVTGGKIGTFANSVGGAAETFGCYTCHAVHTDSINNTDWSAENLVLRSTASANGQWNPICTGCHGDEITGLDDDNPGNTAFFHPTGTTANAGAVVSANVYNYLTSTGSFTFSVDLNAIVNLAPQGSIGDAVVGINAGTSGDGSARPRCGSCHDVHGGVANSMALIDFDGARDGLASATPLKVCDACHNGNTAGALADAQDDVGDAGEPANSHHRTRSGSWATATVTDADGNTLNLDGANSASWLTPADHTNGLDCGDCHVFDQSSNSTAHNW